MCHFTPGGRHDALITLLYNLCFVWKVTEGAKYKLVLGIMKWLFVKFEVFFMFVRINKKYLKGFIFEKLAPYRLYGSVIADTVSGLVVF